MPATALTESKYGLTPSCPFGASPPLPGESIMRKLRSP